MKYFVASLAFILLSLASPMRLYAQESLPRFSASSAGAAIGKPYRLITLPGVKPNRFSLVEDGGSTVLQVESDASASTLTFSNAINAPELTQLSWRWKIDRTLSRADIKTKKGDDFSARVYVFFDVPAESLSFSARNKIRLARMMSSVDVPTAALCYVWDSRADIGHTQWSAYTDRVRLVVLQSGDAKVNQWLRESRDVAADFQAAFGHAAPRITGIAIGNDTDQTRDTARAWFGDFSLHSLPRTEP